MPLSDWNAEYQRFIEEAMPLLELHATTEGSDEVGRAPLWRQHASPSI